MVSPAGRVSPGFTLIELLVVVAVIAILASLLLPALGRSKSLARSVKCMGNQRQIGLAMQLYLHDFGVYPPGGNGLPRTATWYGQLMSLLPGTLPPREENLGYDELFPEVFRCTEPAIFAGNARVEINGKLVANISAEGRKGCIGYNGSGAGENLPSSSGHGLAGGCKESAVVSPSSMIAFGCLNFVYFWPRYVAPIRAGGLAGPHRGNANVAFCDGRVESGKLTVFAARTEAARRRWNRDNEPHPEIWRD